MKEMKRFVLSIMTLALIVMFPMVANASEADMGFKFGKSLNTNNPAMTISKYNDGIAELNFLIVDTDKNVTSADISNMIKEYEDWNLHSIYLKGKSFVFDASVDLPKFVYFVSAVDKLSVKGKVRCSYVYMNSDYYDNTLKEMKNNLIWSSFDCGIFHIYPKTPEQDYEVPSDSKADRCVRFYAPSNWDKNYEYYIETRLYYPEGMNIKNVESCSLIEPGTTSAVALYRDCDNVPVKSNMGEAKAECFGVFYSYRGKRYGADIHLNGGQGRTDMVEFVYNEKITNLPTPTRTGYTFKGWTMNGKTVKNGDVFKETPKTEDVRIDAQWSANTYTVTLNYNDGVTKATNTTVTYDKAYGNLPTPKRDGYEFKGWTINGKVVAASTVVKTASNHTLVATWGKEGTSVKKSELSKVKVKLTAKKKSLVVKITDSKKNKYEIQYSTSKKFKKAATKTIKTSKKKYTIKKLKKNKKYYVRVRSYASYKDENGKTQTEYSKWSSKVNKKTK